MFDCNIKKLDEKQLFKDLENNTFLPNMFWILATFVLIIGVIILLRHRP